MREVPQSKKEIYIVFFALLIIALLAIVLRNFSSHQIETMNQLTSNIYEHPLKVSNAALNVKLEVYKIHRDMKDIVLSTSQRELISLIEEINHNEINVYKHIDIIEKNILGKDGQKLCKNTFKLFYDWKPIRDKVIELVKNNKVTEAIEITKDKGAKHVLNLENSSQQLYMYAKKKAENFKNEADSTFEKLKFMNYEISIIIFFLFLIIAYYTIGRISKYINKNEHLNGVLSVIRDVNQLIVREKEIEKMLQESCNILTSNHVYGHTWIMIFNDHNQLEYITGSDCSQNFEAFKDKIKNAWTPYCIEKTDEKFSYIENTNQTCAECPLKDMYSTNGAFNLELKHGNKLYGYLNISVDKKYILDNDELALLDELAGDISYALYNIQREQLLIEQEERYRFVTEAASDGVWDWNLITNDVYFSPSLKAILGYKDDEIGNVYEEWENRIHPDDKEQIFLDVQDAINKKRRLYRNIQRLKHRDGHWVWVESKAVTLFDDEGKAIRMIGSHTDITKQKMIEQDLLLAKKRFELSEKVGNIGSWEYIIETDEIWSSEQGKLIYGLANKDSAFDIKVIESCIPEKERVHQALVELLEKDTEYNLEFEINPIDGGPTKVISSIAEVQRDKNGVAIKVIGSIQDITERYKVYNLLQNAQELSHLGGWEQNSNDNTLYWSDEVYRIFEANPKHNITYEQFMDRVHPDDRTAMPPIFEKSIDEHIEYYLEHRLLFPDGRIKYVVERAEHFYDKNNKHIRTIGTVQDITEEILSKNEIEKHDEMLTSVFQVIPDLLFIMDEKGLIIDYRAKKDNDLYIKPEQFLSKYMADILPQNIGELFRKNLDSLSENSELNIFKYKLEVEGELRHYEARMAQLPVDNNIMTIVRDITENQENLKRLQQKKQELETTIQEAPNPIMIHNEDGKVLMLNQAWIDSSCFSLEDIPTIDDWVNNIYDDTQTRIAVKEHIYSLYGLTEKSNDGEFTFLNKNREQITWQFSSAPLGMIDGKRTVISSAMDITELKRKDEMLINQSRHAAMGEMIGMIAHQWRQPLSAISMGANNILLDVAMEELNLTTLEDYANTISKQTKHLSQTIDDFRNFFKPDKEISKVNIKDILDQTLSIVKDSLKNHNIKLTSSFETDTEVDAYPRELMQVFVNIINNSKDALVSQRIENPLIEIRVYEDKKYINTEICDNGGGIDANTLPKIFDPYFSTKDEKTGTGLGLYMSKMIIEEHLNGVIEVHNADDGACFTVKLVKEEID